MTQMIDYLKQLSSPTSDLNDALRLLKGRIAISNRFFLVKNKIKIFVSKDNKSCVFRYGQDPVPLFVFNDNYSVCALIIALRNGELND